MELWFTEEQEGSTRFSIKILRHLLHKETQFQQMDIFDTADYGRMLVLDGYVMLTEKDEFIYHDMMVHVPMAANPGIKNVLVIGAGDGGTVRELCRYSTVEKIDMAEIDEEVVRACEEYIPQTACKLRDPRVSIYYQDGLKYVRKTEEEYDLIIVDSTDPVGPGEGLFTKEFYGSCYKALTDDGILVNQHESPFYAHHAIAMKRAHKRLREFFPVCGVYQAHIPTYPSGYWLFGFASKRYDPIGDLQAEAWEALGIETKYYNTRLHAGAFALPSYVREMLNDVGD